MAAKSGSRSRRARGKKEEERDGGGGEDSTADPDLLSQRRRSYGLQNFLKAVEGNQHRVVEMRIAVVCGFGVSLRILFMEEVPEDTLLSTFVLIAMCFIVLIFSTWLDYFPTRLKDIDPRASEGQGIPLGCLLLPTVACAINYTAMLNAPHLTGLISLYQIVLCVLGLCSVVATLLHTIPHPTHVMFYNFACMGCLYVMYVWLQVPLWPLLAGMVLYSSICPWLLYTFPKSFTLAEAMIVAQAATIMFLDTGMQLLNYFSFFQYGYVELPPHLSVARSDALQFVEVLVSGGFLCCLLLSGALYKLSIANYYYDNKFWSGTFLLLSASVYFMIIFPYLGKLLGGHGPIGYVTVIVFSSPVRIGLVVYWLLVSVVTGLVIAAQSSGSAWLAPLKSSSPSSLWMRKWFHLSALFVYLPGLVLEPNFLSLASSLIFTLFVASEVVRYFQMWPVGSSLNAAFQPMTDSKDSGPLMLTHLYLMTGFSSPIWLYPLSQLNRASKLSMYAGVIALGIGDSVAAVAGHLMGKIRWPGTSKSVEGTIMAILTQLLGVLVIVMIDPDLVFFTGKQWLIVTISVILTSVLEAYTQQVDNLVLGLVQFAFLVSFL